MSRREEDIFLWTWSRRRATGWRASLIRGAIIGAIGGFLFAALMFFAMTHDGASFEISEDAAGPILGPLARALGPTLFLFVLSSAAFAGLGIFATTIIWRRMEWRYNALLNAGRQAPEQEPLLTAAEKRSKWMVLGGIGLLCAFLLALALWQTSLGAL